MPKCKRTSSKQYEVLVDFMEKHPELIHGKTSETFNAKQRRVLWDELSCLLNSTSCGPQKSYHKWQKTWSDFKHVARIKASRCLKHPEAFRELSDLEHRVIQLCKWKFRGGLDNALEGEIVVEEEIEVEEPENNPPDEVVCGYLTEVPSTSSAGPREEILVPNILYVTSAEKEGTSAEKEKAKEKKQDVTLEDIKERLETQNNLITEGINFVREIAKSQKKIADAEVLKAQALCDLASTFKAFLEGFEK